MAARTQGRVKSFNAGKGFGFLEAWSWYATQSHLLLEHVVLWCLDLIVGKRSKMLEVSWYEDCWGFSWLSFFFGLPPPENLKVVGTGAIAEDIGCGTDVFVHIKDCALILTKAYQRQYHRIWKGISHISDVSDTLQKSNMANIRQTLQKTWQWKITKFLIRRYDIYIIS